MKVPTKITISGKYGGVLLVDFKDAARLRGLTLNVGKRGYPCIVRYSKRTKRTRFQLLHRFLVGEFDPSVKVDHKDRNLFNAQQRNLRRCTQSQNLANKGLQSNNRSGYKGVVRLVRADKTLAYTVFLKSEGRNRALGTYNSRIVAARVYDREALKTWGEFAQLNFPDLDSSNFYPNRSRRNIGRRKVYCPRGHLNDSVNNRGGHYCSICSNRRQRVKRKESHGS